MDAQPEFFSYDYGYPFNHSHPLYTGVVYRVVQDVWCCSVFNEFHN